MSTASPNSQLATKVLAHLARLGVREFCVAAGARNAPLLAALLASKGARVWNFFDERSAAFFALGRSMAERLPVAVITTSGTAAGELLPAVMEAHYQALPLVLVTADRPARFRGSGAPQAVEQVDLFGQYTGNTLDLGAHVVEARWPDRLGLRPLHVNVCLDEHDGEAVIGIDFAAPPAVPEAELGGWQDEVDAEKRAEGQRALEEFVAGADDSLMVLTGGLHPDHAAQAGEFLQQLGAPVVAEFTANLHDDERVRPLLISGGERALRQLQPRQVLRLGAVPSWRWWRDLEARPEVAVMNLTPALFAGLSSRRNVTVLPLPWLTNWRHAQPAETEIAPVAGRPFARPSSPASKIEEMLTRHPLSEPAWIRRVSEQIPAGAKVFLGNSLPIREWNLAAARPKPGTHFFANRGANGIDGLVSTFFGVSAASAESWLIIGDLTALYDLSAPWVMRQLPAGRRRIVIINNGGGKIFSRVPSLRSLDDPTLAVIENRHELAFKPWADMWGLDYRRCLTAECLQNLPDGDAVIEIVPSARETEAFYREW